MLVLAVLATNLGVGSVNALTTRSQRGMVITTGASLLGMAVGAVIWLVVAPRMGIAGVALGYVCGTVVIAAIPIAVVWRTGGHKWAGVFARVVVGLAMIGAILLLQHTTGMTRWVDPALAVVFLAVWLTLNRSDIAKLPLPARLKRLFTR